MDTVGFIGLGRMGRPMASHLCRKGFDLVVYDVNRDATADLERLGARAAADVKEVATRCGTVLLMLPNSAVVDEVVAGAGGVLANSRPGTLVIDMSTVDPQLTDKLAAAAGLRHCEFVDAPVGRLASHADRAECLFMVGASPQAFEKVRPLLDAMGTTVHHCGPPGAGIRTKLVNNYLAIVSCQLNAEALALAQRFCLPLEKTLKVLYGTTATNGQLKIAWPAKVLAGDTTPGFTIDLAHKDLTLIVDAANAAKVPMPVGAAAREAFSSARSRGCGPQDFSAMVDVLCESAGIPKPRFEP